LKKTIDKPKLRGYNKGEDKRSENNLQHSGFARPEVAENPKGFLTRKEILEGVRMKTVGSSENRKTG